VVLHDITRGLYIEFYYFHLFRVISVYAHNDRYLGIMYIYIYIYVCHLFLSLFMTFSQLRMVYSVKFEDDHE
jgi:hypothetical protein